MFKELGVDMYIVSGDEPAQQKELFTALEEQFGESVPFISDPKLALIEQMGMKNNDIAYRGYGLLSEDGTVVFSTKNDHWGEQLDATLEEIKDHLETK